MKILVSSQVGSRNISETLSNIITDIMSNQYEEIVFEFSQVCLYYQFGLFSRQPSSTQERV